MGPPWRDDKSSLKPFLRGGLHVVRIFSYPRDKAKGQMDRRTWHVMGLDNLRRERCGEAGLCQVVEIL